MNNPIILDNVGCLYTANKDGVQSYENTKIFIDNGLISTEEENKDYLTIDCRGKMVTSGFVTKLAGFDVYSTPEIIEDGNNDEAGCAFSAGAFGFATGSNGIMSIETQRDASARVTEYVGTGVWGECMIKDLWAVSITSDVS